MKPNEILATEAIISRGLDIRIANRSRVPDTELEKWDKENPPINFIKEAVTECKGVFNAIKEDLFDESE